MTHSLTESAGGPVAADSSAAGTTDAVSEGSAACLARAPAGAPPTTDGPGPAVVGHVARASEVSPRATPHEGLRERLGFAATLGRLAVSVLWEFLFFLGNVLLFAARRRRVRRHMERLMSHDHASRSAGGAGALRVAILLVALLGVGTIALSGCRAWNHEWEEFAWSVGALTDIRGDWDRLIEDLEYIFTDDPEDLVESFVLLGF